MACRADFAIRLSLSNVSEGDMEGSEYPVRIGVSVYG